MNGESGVSRAARKLYLAPMEGLADCVLRDVLTRAGGFDLAVSEFIRVSGNLLPERAFRRIVPELANASRTSAGTPVLVQLLGSDPACLAENAAQAAELTGASVRTLKRETQNGRLPCYRVGSARVLRLKTADGYALIERVA